MSARAPPPGGTTSAGSAASTAAEPVTAREAEETATDETPGVLDDLERWMNSLTKTRRARGARHAAVRV